MGTFFTNMWKFLKEIVLFGIDAFMVAAAREVARRFWVRLSGRGGAIAALEEPKDTSRRYAASSGQSALPFLDEYRD
jgi:hypothetical protein